VPRARPVDRGSDVSQREAVGDQRLEVEQALDGEPRKPGDVERRDCTAQVGAEDRVLELGYVVDREPGPDADRGLADEDGRPAVANVVWCAP